MSDNTELKNKLRGTVLNLRANINKDDNEKIQQAKKNQGLSGNLIKSKIIKLTYNKVNYFKKEEIKFSYDDGYEKYSHKKTFEGVINNLERRYLETDSDWKREEIAQYQSDTKCERCNGYRLKDEALCVKINGLHISVRSLKNQYWMLLNGLKTLIIL